MTPVGRRARTPSIQPRPGVRRPCISERTTEDDGAGDALHAPDDLERPLAVELVEDQLQDRRDPLLATGPPVAVLADGRLDPLPRLGRHIGPAVDHLRHRRDRHAGLRGDERDGRAVAGRRRLGAIVEPWRQCSDSGGLRKFRTHVAAGGTCRGRLARSDPRSRLGLDVGTRCVTTMRPPKQSDTFRNFRRTGGRSSAKRHIDDPSDRRPADCLLRWRDDDTPSSPAAILFRSVRPADQIVAAPPVPASRPDAVVPGVTVRSVRRSDDPSGIAAPLRIGPRWCPSPAKNRRPGQ